MADDVAEQLRALTEMVQQLRTENTRLREEMAQRPVAVGVASPVREGPAAQSPARSGVQEEPVAASGVIERLIYMPRDRKCPRFSGAVSSDLLVVEDWIEEVRRFLASRPGSRSEQALIVFDLLDGEARTEVKFRPIIERDDPEKMFTILTSVYGCAQSSISLQNQFFQRRQREGESLRAYSHALLSLMEVVKRRDSSCFTNSDSVLRDQFIEHLRDAVLRRELRRQVRLDPALTFLAIRSEAIRWVEEGESVTTHRARAHSLCTYTAAVECGAGANAVMAQRTDEMTELKEGLRRQQLQLDAIMRRLESPPAAVQPRGGSVHRGPKGRFQAEGRVICLRCNLPGHIARFCRTSLEGGSEAGASTDRAVRQQEN
ncbi:hypothetical protein AMEX_G1371 [Astyanax mexicanus]|uniref:CCHC-type domain-containing protein n=1 Tax=Astyanax mexicanus TaxID=7994 RepID=A0A8T2MGF7_ASTMX|nr:hypothetical protein AMEX_G1371 [Astyanax mexicanus]